MSNSHVTHAVIVTATAHLVRGPHHHVSNRHHIHASFAVGPVRSVSPPSHWGISTPHICLTSTCGTVRMCMLIPGGDWCFVLLALSRWTSAHRVLFRRTASLCRPFPAMGVRLPASHMGDSHHRSLDHSPNFAVMPPRGSRCLCSTPPMVGAARGIRATDEPH
jgi:hypothetical protein